MKKNNTETPIEKPTQTWYHGMAEIKPFNVDDEILPRVPMSERYAKIKVVNTTNPMDNIDRTQFKSPGVFFKEVDGNLPTKESFVRDINATTGKGGGLRFNSDKLRYDLVDPLAHEDMVKVLTYGANKYTVRDDDGNIINKGDDNWRKGLSWKSVLASLKRHVAAIERGEDYDQDTKMLHVAHAACNIHFLNAYYYIYPQGDDRNKTFMRMPKIGLDIDEVLCGYLPAWMEKYGIETFPHSWYFDREIKNRFEHMRETGVLDDFYLNMKPLIDGKDLPFEPHCYITSRPVSKEVTEKWLDMNGFPTKKVYTVDIMKSKAEVAKEAGVEIFIDDSYDNFLDLNKNGVFCYLYTQKHNIKFDVGHMRLNSLHDLPFLK